MAPRKRPSTPPQTPQPPALRIPRNDARQKLSAQIDAGGALLSTPYGASNREGSRKAWVDFTYELLRRMFTTDEYAAGFERSGTSLIFGMAADPLEDVPEKIDELKSLLARLDIIDEDPSVVKPFATKAEAKGTASTNRVFLVHGRDEEAKVITARFLETMGLEVIVLSEQVSGNLTIIEKIEKYSDVDFAIVLLTPDDVGRLASEPASEEKSRARQNVIMELGYFIGCLGRSKVCALKKGDVDIPSDFIGPVYTPMDAAGAWKLTLVKELHAAGLDVDPAALLRA